METDPMLREHNERSNIKEYSPRPPPTPRPYQVTKGEADFGGDQLLHEAYYFCCNRVRGLFLIHL